MFKILKDTRRRAVESILETVGVAEVTTDAEFDVLAAKFDIVIAEMNQGILFQLLLKFHLELTC